MASIDELAVVKEHVTFLIDYADQLAAADVGNAAQTAYEQLGVAIAELTAAQTAINTTYSLGN